MRCQSLRLLNTLGWKNPALVNIQTDRCYSSETDLAWSSLEDERILVRHALEDVRILVRHEACPQEEMCLYALLSAIQPVPCSKSGLGLSYLR